MLSVCPPPSASVIRHRPRRLSVLLCPRQPPLTQHAYPKVRVIAGPTASLPLSVRLPPPLPSFLPKAKATRLPARSAAERYAGSSRLPPAAPATRFVTCNLTSPTRTHLRSRRTVEPRPAFYTLSASSGECRLPELVAAEFYWHLENSRLSRPGLTVPELRRICLYGNFVPPGGVLQIGDQHKTGACLGGRQCRHPYVFSHRWYRVKPCVNLLLV